MILQQPVAREQMTKLLASGATDLLEGFVSNKTRRKFKARLTWDAKEGKVVFAFEPRPVKGPAAKKGAAATSVKARAPAAQAEASAWVTGTPVEKAVVVKKAVAKKAAPKKATKKPAAG